MMYMHKTLASILPIHLHIISIINCILIITRTSIFQYHFIYSVSLSETKKEIGKYL